MTKQLIRLGHSPDPDDAFMFYGLATGAVDPGPFEFQHILQDIQTLNEWAQQAKLEVTAVSVHAYAYLHQHYAILASGASMGASQITPYNSSDTQSTNQQPNSNTAQGPLLIAHQPLSLDQLKNITIAVPGTMTSAFLTLQLAIGQFDYRVMKFDDILPAVAEKQIDAGLIIHEGQLTYQNHQLHCLLDLGQWWHDKTQLPLPLGCNIILRSLGPEKMKQISQILKASIQYSLDNRTQAVEYALQFGRGLNNQLADQFIAMYVNEWTLDYGPKGRQAITQLLQQAQNAKLIPNVPPLNFI